MGFPSLELTDRVALALSDSMRCRGPDDRGWVCYDVAGKEAHGGSGRLLLGHNRLSIIDLSSAGHQPLDSSDGRFTIVYNGEIYNYIELRDELESRGRSFRTKTDTEVLIEAYREWGEGCLTRLEGMFAFALLDRRDSKLVCIRDFFGIKPFFYSFFNGGFAFASELPALLEVPGVRRNLNTQKAYEFLVYGRVDTGHETMIKGLMQLPPAHLMVVNIKTGSQERLERYWKPDVEKTTRLSFPTATDRLREMFMQNVRRHLRSDVPWGVALSGGIDSSAVACAVRAMEPDIPITTFSYVARDSDTLSEEPWIDLVAEHIRAVSRKVFVRGEELIADLDYLIARQGEPFDGTSIYAQYRVFKLARESGVTVTLDGQGADEMLAGYNWYSGFRVASLFANGHPIEALRLFRRAADWPGRSMASIATVAIGDFVPRCLQGIARSVVGQPFSPAWLNTSYFRERSVSMKPVQERPLYSSRHRLRNKLANQTTHHGLPNLLRHGDRNSMTSSIESRVPFCTRELAEFVISLPEEYIFDRDGRTKAIFREAMRGIVPDPILDRRDKIGFQTPESAWLPRMDAWVRPILERAADSAALDSRAIAQEWDLVVTGKNPFNASVWRWLNYLRWKELFSVNEA